MTRSEALDIAVRALNFLASAHPSSDLARAANVLGGSESLFVARDHVRDVVAFERRAEFLARNPTHRDEPKASG